MFSGSFPPGSSSAPGSGKTAISRGRSSRRGSIAGISTEENRRELAPRRLGCGIIEAPRLEEFQQLLPRSLIIPGAIAANDAQQRLRRLLALVRRIQRTREIVARLQVAGVGGDARLERAELIARLAPFLGQRERASCAGDLGMLGDFRWNLCQRFARFVLVPRGD